MTLLARIKKNTDEIHGWTSDNELLFLHETAKKCQSNSTIVEIGSWKGKSTIALGMGAQSSNSKVYAIDPHTGSPDHIEKRGSIWTFDEFQNNVQNSKLTDTIIPLVKTSTAALEGWSSPIDFLYLDVHYQEYNNLKDDFVSWTAFLKNGGFVATHNVYPVFKEIILRKAPFYGWPAPRKLVWKYIFLSRTFRNVGIVDNIVFAQKCERNNILDLTRNIFVGLYGTAVLFVFKIYKLVTKLPIPFKGKLIHFFRSDK